MANIPAVPGTEVLNAPNQAPRLNSGAFSGLARGREARDESVARAGEVFGQLALQMQETRNTAALAHADIVMRQGTDSFLDSLQHDPQGYGKWNDEFAAQAATIKEQAFDKYQGMSLAPEVKQKLSLAFNDWQQRTASQVNVLATRAEINHTANTLDHASDSAAQQGDEAGALAPYLSAGAKHIFTDVQLQARMDGVKNKIENYQVDSGLMNNPAATSEQLEAQTPSGRYQNFTHLDPNVRLAKIRMAKVLVNQGMMANYREVSDQVEGGRIYNRAELENMVSQHKLKPDAVDILLNKQAGVGKIANQPAYAARAIAEVNDLPPPHSEEERVKATLGVVSSPDYLRLMPDVRKQVDAFMALKWGNPKAKAHAANPVQAHIFKQASADYAAGLFLPPKSVSEPVPGTGWFAHIPLLSALPGLSRLGEQSAELPEPMSAEDLKALKSNALNPESRKIRAQEQQNYAAYLNQMTAFFAANPTASYAEAQDASEKFMQPHALAAVENSLQTSPEQATPVNGGYVVGQIYTYPDGRKMKFVGGNYLDGGSFEAVK